MGTQGYSVLTCTKQNVGGTHILFCAKIRILQPGRVQFPYEELSVRKLHCNKATNDRFKTFDRKRFTSSVFLRS